MPFGAVQRHPHFHGLRAVRSSPK